jgi:spore germination protein KB
MIKEEITPKEAICLLINFIMGSTLILGIGSNAKNDAWIAGIFGLVMAVPIIMIYSRILQLFPGKNLYDISYLLLGKYLGSIIIILYIWYSFHLGALVIRNFGEFLNSVTMPETPMLVSMLSLILICIIAVRLGIEVISRTSAYLLPILIFILIIVQLLSVTQMHLQYIEPILYNGLSPVLKEGFSAFAFPFAEAVIFLGILGNLQSKKSYYKIYLTGLLVAGGIIIILVLRNIFLLGNQLSNYYFPSHVAVSRIQLGDFLQRIEVTVAFIFVVGVFIKTSLCLLFTCKGIAKLFHLNDYRSIVIQTGLLMVYLAYILYDDIIEMHFWAFSVYKYYSFPFQVILPLLIFIIAELKKKGQNKNSE